MLTSKTKALVSLLLLLLLSTFSVKNMEQVQFDYSLKNIAIPTQKDYLIELVSSVNTFIANLKWRCFHFLNPSNSNHKETYGFKTTTPPPSIAELKQFEGKMHDIVQNVKFKHPKHNDLQKKMNDDIKNIKNDGKVYVAADKTSNFYKMDPERYTELLGNNITKEYKKVGEKVVDKINSDDKKLAKKLELDDRIYSMSKRQSYITLKDHKESFPNNVKCRLINPSKSEIGKVSKRILSKVVQIVRDKTRFNHWKNSEAVINWFVNLQEKQNLVFIQFDIKDFYPSIRKDLLTKALNFASRYTQITAEEKKIIFQCRNSILFDQEKPWNKKGINQFDVTMGSWDGAEVCELVGLYLLSQLSDLSIHVGLYRDDGLCACALNPRQTELIKKKICKVFKDNDLSITVEANAQNVNFLDINLDLETGLFKPYM